MKKIASVLVIILVLCVFPCRISAQGETYIKDEYVKIAYEVAEMYSISPELIIAMIETESGGRPKVKSNVGAIGLMQVIPKWNKDRMKRLGVTDLTDPYQNILCGTDLVYELFEKYTDVPTVLMCYNEGEYGTAIERSEKGKFSKYAKKIMNRLEELTELHESEEVYAE